MANEGNSNEVQHIHLSLLVVEPGYGIVFPEKVNHSLGEIAITHELGPTVHLQFEDGCVIASGGSESWWVADLGSEHDFYGYAIEMIACWKASGKYKLEHLYSQ